VQKRLDLIVFMLKLKEHVVDEGLVRESLEKHARKVLNLPEEVTVEAKTVDDIPLDKNGKFRIVISELDDSK
jgi:hypothetical protein